MTASKRLRTGDVSGPIVFLDWDGVLCTQAGYLAGPLKEGPDGRYDPPFQPECIEQFARVIAETGAKVVLSTAWRSAGAVRCGESLRAAGCHAELIGCTPWLNRGPRADEIVAWVVGAKYEGEFCVIDDDSDAWLGRRDCFVQTSMEHGLTPELADRAIRILKGGQ